MPTPARALACTVLFAFAATICAAAAQAQNYPDRTIKLIVPFPPGGAVDTTARLIQPGLEKALGQSVIVENRAGASGLIGTDAVAKAASDGYTLLVVASTHTVNSALHPKLPYDPEKDLAPVIQIANNPLIFVVNPNVPAKDLKEFIALAKSQPGKLNYGSPGTASQPHLVTELFAMRTDVKMQHIPYRGGAPATIATIAGDVQLSVLAPQSALTNIQAGKLRAIAVGGLKRDPVLPDVPTVAEQGLPGFEAIQWFGLFAPANTPKPVIDKINRTINDALRDPALVSRMKEHGVAPAGGSAEDFRKLVASETKNWSDVGKATGVKLEP